MARKKGFNFKSITKLKPLQSVTKVGNSVAKVSTNAGNNIGSVYTMARKKRINFKGVMKDIRKATHPVGKALNKVVSAPMDMMKLGAGTLTSLGSSLSMPLLVCGAGVVIYLVTKK